MHIFNAINIFNKCIQKKVAAVTPLFKSGYSDKATNYRTISFLSLFSKYLKKLSAINLIGNYFTTVKWGYFELRGYFEHFYIFYFFLFYILDYILKLINISFNLLFYLFVNQKNCLSYPASAT